MGELQALPRGGVNLDQFSALVLDLSAAPADAYGSLAPRIRDSEPLARLAYDSDAGNPPFDHLRFHQEGTFRPQPSERSRAPTGGNRGEDPQHATGRKREHHEH